MKIFVVVDALTIAKPPRRPFVLRTGRVLLDRSATNHNVLKHFLPTASIVMTEYWSRNIWCKWTLSQALSSKSSKNHRNCNLFLSRTFLQPTGKILCDQSINRTHTLARAKTYESSSKSGNYFPWVQNIRSRVSFEKWHRILRVMADNLSFHPFLGVFEISSSGSETVLNPIVR